jgi:hypothetical protein
MSETKEKTKGVGGNGNLIPCKPGETHNPNGRPKGQRNYATIYREAIIKIGQSKGMTPEEVEEELERVGLGKALSGDFKFWQDVRDRIHGKPRQAIEHTGEGGEPIKHSITVTFE